MVKWWLKQKIIIKNPYKTKYLSLSAEISGGYDFSHNKYYDIYAYATVDEQYQRRILGDATEEIGPFGTVKYLTQTRQIGSWYTNQASFIWSSSPWFIRGAPHTYGLNAGAFAFGNGNGHVHSAVSFRMILTPE